MKLVEQLSHEDVTSQTSEQLTALEEKFEQIRRLEPSAESELESVKEVTQREADGNIHRLPSRADELQSVEPTFDELRDLDQECHEFEHSLTKLQEELDAESTNELK